MSAGSQLALSSKSSLAKRVRPYRLLILVYVIATAAACWELVHRGEKVDLYLDTDNCFVETLGELYPDQPRLHLLKTTQIMLCASARGSKAWGSGPCKQYANVDFLRVAKEHFELGLKYGKDIEDLSYQYVRFLSETESPKSKIEAAYQEWRKRFPTSDRPDPRRRIAAQN